MPTIEVFLTFKPDERNSLTKTIGKVKKTTIESGPDWKLIAGLVSKKGYKLIVHGPAYKPSAQEIQDSTSNAEVTLIVGHGIGTHDHGSKFITHMLELNDGMIRSPDGIFVGQWKRGKAVVNKVTGIFTCNSTEMLDVFAFPLGSHLIVNDGGDDGLTRVGTLELGAAEFVRRYALSKGNIEGSMKMAQAVFTQKGRTFKGDKGDTLFQIPGPERCEVKDW
jgi:hypothetical protein